MPATPHPPTVNTMCELQVTALLGDWIGALTLTGSAIAFGKLHGIMGSAPLTLPGRWQAQHPMLKRLLSPHPV